MNTGETRDGGESPGHSAERVSPTDAGEHVGEQSMNESQGEVARIERHAIAAAGPGTEEQ